MKRQLVGARLHVPTGLLPSTLVLSLAACQTPAGPSNPVPSPSPPPPTCAAWKYLDETFAGDVITRDVLYSSVVDAFGVHDLRMDIYRPGKDPSPSRPAIVWVFGGNFLTGDRSQLADYAVEFARRGYVTATIDYRLLKSYDPFITLGVALAAAQSDAQAAIRYLRVHADGLAIDPGRIAIGGWSAGSLTAFAVGYNYEFMGDNLDNPGQPHTVGVVIGLDGFLATPGQMRVNDPPFVLFRSEHLREDNPEAVTALLLQAGALGIANEVHVVPGAMHADLTPPSVQRLDRRPGRAVPAPILLPLEPGGRPCHSAMPVPRCCSPAASPQPGRTRIRPCGTRASCSAATPLVDGHNDLPWAIREARRRPTRRRRLRPARAHARATRTSPRLARARSAAQFW